jgi:hypothetical protein
VASTSAAPPTSAGERRIACRQPAERHPELHRLLEVGRPLAARVRVNEVWNGRLGPRGLDDARDFSEILSGQLGKRNAARSKRRRATASCAATLMPWP